MAIDSIDTIDSVAYENNLLILQIYDHLEFDEQFEYDHMMLLQDKLNTYIWYIDSKQYQDTYPRRIFSHFEIRIFFLSEPSKLCKEYLEHVNLKLSGNQIIIKYQIEKDYVFQK